MKVFAEAQAALTYGFYERLVGFNQSSQTELRWEPELLRIDNLLQLELLQKQFADPQFDPPKENENHLDYLRRLVQVAAAENNWEKVLKLLTAGARAWPGQKQVWRAPSSFARDSEEALNSFVAGKHLEEAGQYTSAIVAYRKVVASSAEFVPREEAAECLKKLGLEHSEAVEKAGREQEIREIVKTIIDSLPPREPGRRGPY